MASTNGALPETRIYDVELSTLLGKRVGSLGLQICGECLSGVLKLMKAENLVQGRLFENGACSLTGSLRTRMNNYSFTGEGLLLPERMDMLLRCAGITLPLRGTRREE